MNENAKNSIVETAKKMNETFDIKSEENKNHYKMFKWLIGMYEMLTDEEIIYSCKYESGLIKVSRIAFPDGVVTI